LSIFDNYDIVIYIDGSAQITNPNFLKIMLENYEISKYPLTLTSHGERICAYDEANICTTIPKYQNTIDLVKQTTFYREEGLPPNWGLFWSGLIFYNFSSKENRSKLIEFTELWYKEMHKYIYKTFTPFKQPYPQGQVSLSYALWKTGINFNGIPPCYFNQNYGIVIHGHSKII
jgi:hypothetical protein